jgi:hypothetical protein
MKVASTEKLGYPMVRTANDRELLNWALSVMGARISQGASPNAAPDKHLYLAFERLLKLRMGTNLGMAVMKDLEALDSRIKHLETNSNVKTYGKQSTQKVVA